MFGVLRVGAANTTTCPWDEAQRMKDASMIEVSEEMKALSMNKVVFGLNGLF